MNIVLASRRKYMRKRTNPEGAPASVEDCIVSLVRDSFPYTGQAITPQVTVTTQDGVPLVVNIDYFVSYSDNVNVGAGTVTVTGSGEYVGSVVKTFQITSAAPASSKWHFDISLTSSTGKHAGLLEGQNNINAISSSLSRITEGDSPDVEFVISTGSSGYFYSWGFEEGHAFEVDHFNENYSAKKSGFVSNATGCTLSLDGRKMFFGGGSNSLYIANMSVPFDISSATWVGLVKTLTVNPVFMFFSPVDSQGGNYFIYKDGGARIIHSIYLSIAYDFSTVQEEVEFDLKSIGYGQDYNKTVYGLAISPDGKNIVISLKVGSGSIRVAKLKLSTAWDISTIEYEGESDDLFTETVYNPGTIAIDDDGRKMLLFYTANKEFYEFDLHE